MPYTPLTDVTWQSTPAWDRAGGIYNEHYGLPGPSDSYPYKKGSTFLEGWGKPAVHRRQVLFLKPDVFLVWDRLESLDQVGHEFDVRWHLDSTHVRRDGALVRTADPGKPNLAVVPLDDDGLTVRVASAQKTPELLGWHILKTARPATTIQHLKKGSGADFLTLLLPLAEETGGTAAPALAHTVEGRNYTAVLSDGRSLRITLPEDPEGILSAEWIVR